MHAHDVFICHAGEDKEDVARPLARALAKHGMNVWLDELRLTIGDSLNSRIEQALAQSRFGVVILSPAFFAKEWPQRELAGLAAREIDGRRKVILPVWHHVDHHYIAERSPILADRLGVSTSAGLKEVADKVVEALTRAEPAAVEHPLHTPAEPPRRVLRRLAPLAAGVLAAVVAFITVILADHAHGAEPLSASASNQALTALFPGSWHRATIPPSTAGLPLTNSLGLIAPEAQSGSLVLGFARKVDQATLLPVGFLEHQSQSPKREIVRLGTATYLRYSDLVLPGATAVTSIYVQRTTAGAFVGVCTYPKLYRHVIDVDCERTLSSIVIDGAARSLPVAPAAHTATAMSSAMARIRRASAEASQAIANATNSAAQALAAERAADAYNEAATSLRTVSAEKAEEPARDQLLRAMSGAAGAWATLASSLRSRNANAYGHSRGLVIAKTAAVSAALPQFETLGYDIEHS